MAETNLGRVAIVPKGTYSASVQYYYLDLVYYQGSSYLVHTQPTIGTLPTDTNYFYLAAEGAEVEMRYDSVTDYIQWKLITDVTWNNLIQPADFTPTVVQTTGTSETDVMSQKAVSELIEIDIAGANKFDSRKAVLGKTVYGTAPYYEEGVYPNAVALFGINVSELAGEKIQISGLPAYDITGGYGRYYVVRDINNSVILVASTGSSSADAFYINLPAAAITLDVDMCHNNVVNYDYSGCFIGLSGSAYEESSYKIKSVDNFPIQDLNLNGVDEVSIQPVVLKNLYESAKVISGLEVYGDGSLDPEPNSAVFKFEVLNQIADKITISGLQPYNGLARYYSVWGDWAGSEVLSVGTIPTANSSATISLPAGAKAIVFSVYQRVSDAIFPSDAALQIEYGSVATTYTANKVQSEVALTITKGDARAKIGAATSTNSIKILVFGDSITETEGITYYSDADPYTLTLNTMERSNWLKWLYLYGNQHLSISEYRNYAMSGASIRNTNIEKRQYLGFQIDEAIADLTAPSGGYYYGQSFTPDVIVLSLGTNDADTASTYETAMAKTILNADFSINVPATMANLDVQNSLSEALRHSLMKLRLNFPNAVYIMATPTQQSVEEQYPATLTAIEKVAGRYGCIIAKVYEESGIVRDFQPTDGSSGDLYDGLHPNETGQKKMARVIANTIISNTLWRI